MYNILASLERIEKKLALRDVHYRSTEQPTGYFQLSMMFSDDFKYMTMIILFARNSVFDADFERLQIKLSESKFPGESIKTRTLNGWKAISIMSTTIDYHGRPQTAEEMARDLAGKKRNMLENIKAVFPQCEYMGTEISRAYVGDNPRYIPDHGVTNDKLGWYKIQG
jgi:hypothetical protein